MKRKRLTSFQQLIQERRRSRRQRLGQRPRGTLSGELKFHDIDISQAPVAIAGDIVEDSLLTIVQGTNEGERIGRKITVKQIAWRMAMVLPAQTDEALTSESLRLILYLDKQTNGATATVTGILETAEYQSFNNLANKSRFRILYDRMFTFSATAGGTSAAGVDQFGEVRKDTHLLKNLNIVVEYDNTFTDGRITTMRSNNLGILCLSQTAKANLNGKVRIRFTG